MFSRNKYSTPVRPRPGLFRALGLNDPPLEIEVKGKACKQIEIFKHDSWAATALYEGVNGKITCKFNRQQSIFGFPMSWLGRMLARREARVLTEMVDTPNIPDFSGNVTIKGKLALNAVARNYVEGHPLMKNEYVGDDFFSRLSDLLGKLHRHNFAYVDLHKRENIIVGNNGEPYLIDFQVSFRLPDWWPGNSWPMRTLLSMLQQTDEHHRLKHFRACRPDQFTPEEMERASRRPWWIRAHRVIAKPLRELRRKFLIAIGIRSGLGQAHSEYEPEQAVRNEIKRKHREKSVRKGQEKATFDP